MKLDDYFEKILPITNWSGVLKAAGIEPAAMSKHQKNHQDFTRQSFGYYAQCTAA